MSELPGWSRGGRGDEKVPAQPIVKKKEYLPKREDGWTLVGRAGKQKAPAAVHEGASCAESSSRPVSSDACAGRLSDAHVVRQKRGGSGFDRALATVRGDEALISSIVAAIATRWPQQPVSSVIVLGIGSPTTSASSRHQLALAGLLSEKLGLRGTHTACLCTNSSHCYF
jgi:SRR1